MPILAGLLVSLFSGAVDFFTRWLTKKLAIGVAAVTTFAALTAALFTGLGLLLSGVASFVPSDSIILMGLWVACPDNTQAVIAATISADTAIALYRWNVQNLKLLSYIT